MDTKNTQTQVNVESFINSLSKASTAFRDLADCLDTMANSIIPVIDESKTPDPAEDVASTKKKSAPVKSKSKETIEADEELTEEYLNGLSYNELKKLAKSRGILAVGARDEITQKILNGDTDTDTATDDEEEEEETSTPAKKSPLKMKPEPKEEPDDNDDEEVEDDPIVTQVNEAVEGMTDEEIADFLTDAGIRARGKRQALIALVIKAVREGKIELEDDGEESDDSSDDIEDDIEKEQDYSDNDLDNPNLTKKRRKALEEFINEAKSDFKSGELTTDDLIEWLSDNNFGKKALLKKKSDKELLDLYIEKACYFIDDDGDFTEDGGYTVNDQPYCCGRPLKYNEDTKTYVCEECGGEYEL